MAPDPSAKKKAIQEKPRIHGKRKRPLWQGRCARQCQHAGGPEPLIELLSIYRNFFLGREKLRSIGPFRVLDKRGMKEECETSLRHIGIRVRTSEETVAILSGSERQSISIGRCMHFGVKLLILDEPLNNLSLKETQVVLGHARAIRDQGVSVIFISHNIHQLYPVADRFVIIEEGRVIENVEKKDTSLEKVIKVIAEGKYRASRLG